VPRPACSPVTPVFNRLLRAAPPPPENHKTSDDPVSGERPKRVDGACSAGAMGGVPGPSGPPLLVPRRGPRRDTRGPAPDAAGILLRPCLPRPPERWVMEAMVGVGVERVCVAGQQRGEERRGSRRREEERRGSQRRRRRREEEGGCRDTRTEGKRTHMSARFLQR
jgi:hypothetical protein